jgi:hypothetical protein
MSIPMAYNPSDLSGSWKNNSAANNSAANSSAANSSAAGPGGGSGSAALLLNGWSQLA